METVLFQPLRVEFWILAALAATATAILIARYPRSTQWTRRLGPADIHKLAPFAMGLMGVVNLVSAIWPRSPVRMAALETWLPLEVTQRSRPLMLFAGLALLQVTRNLRRRKLLAWYVATTVLAASLLLHVTRAFDLHHSLVSGLLLAYLIYFRHRFYARSDGGSIRLGLAMAPVLAAVVIVYGYVGLNAMHARFSWEPGNNVFVETLRSGILITEPHLDPLTSRAARFLGSLQIAGWIARFYLLVLLLRPVVLRSRQEAPAEKLSEIFRNQGSSSLAAFAIQKDKHHLLTVENRALVAYTTRNGVAFCCGDPLAADADFESSVRDYLDHCRRQGWTACIYEASEARLPVYQGLGLHSLKIAEEAVIDLATFSLSADPRQNIRSMVNKAAKTGMQCRRYERGLEPDPLIDEQLEEISQEWLEQKKTGELGFTMGRFSLEAIEHLPLFICTLEGRVIAFCSWLNYRNGSAAILDLMRKRDAAPAGTMDFLLAHALLQLKADGLLEASLANAPLANTSEPRTRLERGVAMLFENMNSFYGYKNLFQFKKKFVPRWEGRYLIYPKGADLPKVAYALTGVYGAGGRMNLIRRQLETLRFCPGSFIGSLSQRIWGAVQHRQSAR